MSDQPSTGAQPGVQSPTPLASVRSVEQSASRRLKTRLWWLTALCLALSIGLVVSSFRRQGKTITVRFKDGYRLKVGDTLRYRGIDCGSVTAVQLAEELDGVDVSILLRSENESLAVEGSQFWIQRARLSLGQISGLDTVLGAKYVGVIPGNSRRFQRDFVGIETPLAMTEGDSADVRIHFPTGEGLEIGNAVRFRGIKIGEVTNVDLSPDLQQVDVTARLVGAARELAREGTQFWIEYPRLELTEIRGLDTVLGGSYVALEPGSQNGSLWNEFVGLAEPPPLPRRAGSLEVELDASTRMGIVRGAPVAYRGLEVGKVAHVGLSKDGASVKVTAVVDSEYAELVREDSKWWVIRGISFKAGLTGIELSMDSFASWVRGGVAFATPPSPGRTVVTGHRFMLESQPQSDWLEWQPRIAVGGAGKSASGLPFPLAQRVVVSWKASIFGIGRRQTEKCWGLALDNGFLALPASFVESASRVGSGAMLEIAGEAVAFEAEQVILKGSVGLYPLPSEWSGESWATDSVHFLEKSITSMPASLVLLVVNPELSEPLAIDSTRFDFMDNSELRIARGVPIPKQLNGSPVIEASSGKVVGLLSSTEAGWVVGALR